MRKEPRNMQKSPSPTKLNRYTSLPVALDVLSQKRITLLTPGMWEDRNDAYYLEKYREKGNFASVLAVCFSQRSETCHHWHMFASGFSGVRIEFDGAKLLASVNGVPGYRTEEVIYQLIRKVRKDKPDISKWPFLKRKQYKDEGEFRIVYESKTDVLPVKYLPIDLASVRRVTLSPWMPEAVADSVKDTIRKIDGCGRLKVNRSSLLENTSWKNAIE